jgi:hypothetical protein
MAWTKDREDFGSWLSLLCNLQEAKSPEIFFGGSIPIGRTLKDGGHE